jgi:hypothetical protein
MSVIQDHQVTSIITFIFFIIFMCRNNSGKLLKDRMTYITILFIDFPSTDILYFYHSHAPRD